MDIFKQFETIDEKVNSIKKKNMENNEQLLASGQSAGAMGGMGFGGTLYHNGNITSGYIDGQQVNLYDVGAMTTGTIGGQSVNIYHSGSADYIY